MKQYGCNFPVLNTDNAVILLPTNWCSNCLMLTAIKLHGKSISN